MDDQDEVVVEMNELMDTLDYGPTRDNFLKANGWPAALVKAASDSFIYALGLGDGTVIVFESATPSADLVWAHLTVPRVLKANKPVVGDWRWSGSGTPDPSPINFDRGIDVRVSEVIWACDAPWGS